MHSGSWVTGVVHNGGDGGGPTLRTYGVYYAARCVCRRKEGEYVVSIVGIVSWIRSIPKRHR